jgi:hypothetical protein
MTIYYFGYMKVIIFLVFILLNNLLYSQDNQFQENHGIDSSLMRYIPGDHELMLMPTAYTMEEGSSYFANYELFLLNFVFAPSSSTHIGAFFFFPVTVTFLETFTVGAKQNYFKSDKFQGAVFGTFTLKEQLYSIGNVFSIGDKNIGSLHAGFGYAGAKNENTFLILLGGRYDFSPKISGIVEYTNTKEFLDQEFKGLITFGIRFRGQSSSWELGGIRPLTDTGKFLFFPLLKGSFYF